MLLSSSARVVGEIHDLIAEAFENLLGRRQRTALALIGVVIGTGSVVATIIIGYNAKVQAAQAFRGLGIDTIVVQVINSPRPISSSIKGTIALRIPTIDRIESAIMGQATVSTSGVRQAASVVAAEPGFGVLASVEPLAGRTLQAVDATLLSATIGSDLAKALSEPGRPVVVGSQVRIQSYLFTVVGILDTSRTNPLLPFSLGNSVIIPTSSARRVISASSPNLFLLHNREVLDPQPIADAVTRNFLSEQQATVTVQTARQSIEAQREQQSVIGRLLMAIGSISLVVGGIGITNVMLMGLMERRSEFGLRLAVGATPMNVMLAVLVEGAILGLIGGLAGSVCGVLVAAGFANYSGWIFAAPAIKLLLCAAISPLIGILFGLYPAVQAARLDPVTALRAD